VTLNDPPHKKKVFPEKSRASKDIVVAMSPERPGMDSFVTDNERTYGGSPQREGGVTVVGEDGVARTSYRYELMTN
jgi:hypothetical protein